MPRFTCVFDWNVIKSRFLDVKGPLERFVEFPRLLMADGRPFVQSKYLGRWQFELSLSPLPIIHLRAIIIIIDGAFRVWSRDYLTSFLPRSWDGRTCMTFFFFLGLFIHVSLHDVDVPNAHNSQSYLPYTHTSRIREREQWRRKNLKSNDDDMHLFIKESWSARMVSSPTGQKVFFFFFSPFISCVDFFWQETQTKKQVFLYINIKWPKGSQQQHTSRVFPPIYY